MTIKEIQNLNEFIDFPYKLYKNDPYWIGDLKKDVIKILSPSHPFWLHSERKLFMVYEGNKAIGRIAAIINHNHNSFQNEKCGFIGFFDCENNKEAANLLFSSAIQWLKTQGMDIVRGPANPSSNEVWGLLIEGFNSSNVIMMPYNYPYYISLFENYGFRKEKDLFAFKFITEHGFPERFEKIVQRSMRSGNITIESVDRKEIDKSLDIVKDIYNKAWEKNWGFVPMTEKEIENMANDLKPILKKEYLFFVKVNNEPAAFCLMLPDFNIALKSLKGKINILNFIPFLYKMFFKLKSGRLLALGVKKEFRYRGLELILIKQAIENAKKLGWEYSELSWTLEDNYKINSIIEEVGGFLYKKYRIYRKDI